MQAKTVQQARIAESAEALEMIPPCLFAASFQRNVRSALFSTGRAFVACRYVPAHKLVDVPELGYTTKDKPFPRGELRVKTRRMIPGYYKHPEVQ